MARALVVLLALAGTATAEPRIASPSAIAIDAATGDVLLAKRPDEVRAIASMTKLFAALVLRKKIDLAAWTAITADDLRASQGGAQSPLREGQAFKNRDLLDAMLIASDNRVPTALARSVGWSPGDLLARMRSSARDLGLTTTKLDDVVGLAGNTSTAREMALALREAIRDPLLRKAMTTKRTLIRSRSGESTASYTSTLAPLWDDRHRVVGGKTGWTEQAGYCELVAVELGERTIVIALLGAAQKSARYDDYIAIVAWMERLTSSQRPPSRPRPASASR